MFAISRSYEKLQVLSFLLFCLVGCAPSSPTFYLAPEYRNIRTSEASILVLPYIGKMMTQEQWQVFIERKTKEQKLATRLEVDLFEGYFQVLFAEKTHARVVSFGKGETPTKLQLRYSESESNIEPKMSLLVPASGTLQVNGETPEFLLVVQDLYFMRAKTDGPGVRIPGGPQSADYVMESGLDYLIWDNKNNKAVTFGRLNKRTPLLAPPGKELYLNILEEFAGSIIRNSPLAEKQTVLF